MKKFLLLSLLCLIILPAMAWKPLFVGHRGCIYGVENTREAFINAKDHYGYDGVETDFMTTSDGKVVMSHDDELNRFGHAGVKISKTTLADLQKLTLTQTRYGRTYTGKIMTVDEFCALIDSLNIFPIMEIKGSAGLYQEGMSNFPQVYQAMVNHNLVDKAIILTSYQKSLEYIRTNYPQVKCQLLMYNMSESTFRWCDQWRVNPSMCNSGGGQYNICQELVKRCHDHNLQVGIWVVDWANVYDSECAWGCYMCTTDSLTPALQKDLPDVDWDNLCPFSKSFDKLYVTPLANPAPQPDRLSPFSATLSFPMEEHEMQITEKGTTHKGGWEMRDTKVTKHPVVYTQSDFLTTASTSILFAYEQLDSATVNVYEYDGSVLLRGWNISTAAPLYPAEVLTLSIDENTTMNVGDTLLVDAFVQPDSCTSTIAWRISEARAINMRKMDDLGRQIRLIAKSAVKNATLTATVDDIKQNYTIQVVKATGLDELPLTNGAKQGKIVRNGRVIILRDSRIYSPQGQILNQKDLPHN